MSHGEMEKKIKDALYTFDSEEVLKVTKEILDEGAKPIDVINVFSKALEEIGQKFENGELWLTELIFAGEAARKAIMELVEPKLRETGTKREVLGKVVLGTVAGDIHDIGKNIVAALLFASGFEVIDLGKDVPVERFVEAVKEYKPDILGLSALMTTTMLVQKDVIEALKKAGLRDKVKVIVGGAPTSREWAREIGADAHAADATEGVEICKKLVKGS